MANHSNPSSPDAQAWLARYRPWQHVVEPVLWILFFCGQASLNSLTVWLDAPDAVLLDRLQRDTVVRPLLAGDALAALGATRTRRAAFYRAADLHLDADAPPETLAARVAEAAGAPKRVHRRLM